MDSFEQKFPTKIESHIHTNFPECLLSTTKGLFLYDQAKKKKKASMQQPN